VYPTALKALSKIAVHDSSNDNQHNITANEMQTQRMSNRPPASKYKNAVNGSAKIYGNDDDSQDSNDESYGQNDLYGQQEDQLDQQTIKFKNSLSKGAFASTNYNGRVYG
jgi:hypothetical protein